MQQFLIPSSTGSSQIINIPVSLLSQSNQQPISFITANGQIFQIPSFSQLVVHQNSDGSTSTTSTSGSNPTQANSNSSNNSIQQQQQQQQVTSASSSSTASTTSNNQANSASQQALVINQQGQLISLPVLQAAAAVSNNNQQGLNQQQANNGQNNNSQFTINNNVNNNSNSNSQSNQLLQAVNLSQLQFAALSQNSNQQQQGQNQTTTQSNNIQALNRSSVAMATSSPSSSNANSNNNGQTPIKTLLEEDDKSDTSIDDQGPTIANMPSNMNNQTQITHATTVDGVNLDEIREFAKAFKLRRLALGLTQTQVGQALSATKGPAYSQSAICRFEKLDITPKSAAKIKPVLEKWMQEAELKYADRLKTGSHQNFADLLGTENTKKRKRRTSFTPQALEILNDYFEKNTHPSGNQGADMTMLAQKLNYDREVIRVWFCNKRQALKNTLKKVRTDGLDETCSDASLSPNSSSHSINQTLNSQLIQSVNQQQQEQQQALVIVNSGSNNQQILYQAHTQDLSSLAAPNNNTNSNTNSTPIGTPTKTVITLTNTKLEPQLPSHQNESNLSNNNQSPNLDESNQNQSQNLVSSNHDLNNASNTNENNSS